ncbi:hypothetical protein WJX82_003394 [Trebouxia sp. C0006]
MSLFWQTERLDKRRRAAVVLPERMADEGVALESSFRDGVKNEVLRSLSQLGNTRELALEVCVVQMQRQQSLSKRGSGVSVTEEWLFEHERFMPLAGWSSRHLLPTERNRYSRQEDGMNSTNTFPQIRLPEGTPCPLSQTISTTSIRAIAAENSKKEVQRTLLGIVHPGDSIPVPCGWQKAGKQLAVRSVLDTERPDTHGRSLGASDGDHNIRLDAEDEGLTRLVASLPTDEAESKGETWFAFQLMAASKEYQPLMDWKVMAAAPLVIENQLPIKGTYLIWETPKDGGNMMMRQSGAIDSGQRVHIYSADMRRSISLQFYPDGYDLVEPQPVLVSEGYSSHQAGSQGKQRLPEKFHVAMASSEPQEIFLGRDIDTDAWQMQDKQLEPGAAVARGSPLLVDPNLMNPRGCRQVGPGAVTMMAYLMQRMTAFKQQGDRPQFFGLCLRIGKSGWAPPLPLESSDSSSQADDMNTKPMLLRAQIPEWGTVHEVVARVEMAGAGFEHTIVLRLEPHCVIPNRTGTPLQSMHFNTGTPLQITHFNTGNKPPQPLKQLGQVRRPPQSRQTTRAQRGLLHHRTRQSGNGDEGPEAMEEVEEAYGKLSPQRYPLDPPDPKSVTGEDSSTHNRGMRGPLARPPLSVQPGEVLVQIVDREQELMSTAGLQSLGGGPGLGQGGLDRELRIVPTKPGQLSCMCRQASARREHIIHALNITISLLQQFFSLPPCSQEGPKWGACGAGAGISRRQERQGSLSLQNLQIDDQLSESRFPAVSKTLQISLSETLVWRAAEMVQRLDLTSLAAPEDEEHTEAATDVPMQMSLVSISSLAAKVSFRGDLAARPRWAGRTLSWALDMANFENVLVQLTGFEMENSTMLWSVFISEVGQNIKRQLVGVALSFLRNFGILSGASGMLGSLSSGVASAALDDRFAVQRAQEKQERSIDGVGDGMAEGGAALGMGIYRGFTGLVTKHVEGAKSKGVGVKHVPRSADYMGLTSC